MLRRSTWLALSVFLWAAGCQNKDDQIQSYRVSKEAVAMAPSAGAAPASSHEMEWKVPSGWREQPPSSMRAGSFLAKGSDGHDADVSVVPLSGDAGGDLANINRWRGQINLEPISETEFAQTRQKITPGGRSMLLIDFVSRDPLVDNRFPKRLVAAIYKQGSRTWFFKMTGADAAVREAKPAFLEFLKNLHPHAAD